MPPLYAHAGGFLMKLDVDGNRVPKGLTNPSLLSFTCFPVWHNFTCQPRSFSLSDHTSALNRIVVPSAEENQSTFGKVCIRTLALAWSLIAAAASNPEHLSQTSLLPKRSQNDPVQSLHAFAICYNTSHFLICLCACFHIRSIPVFSFPLPIRVNQLFVAGTLLTSGHFHFWVCIIW